MNKYNCYFVAGNPETRGKITLDKGLPQKRDDALSAAKMLCGFGWRSWVEHRETCKRIFESEAEKTFNKG